MDCDQCKEYELDFNFCPHCGTPLAESEPLTLDQLKQMHNTPVWVEFSGDEEYGAAPKSHWCFIDVCGGMVDAYPCDIHEVHEYEYPHSAYGNGWLAFAHKPKTQPTPKKGGI